MKRKSPKEYSTADKEDTEALKRDEIVFQVRSFKYYDQNCFHN